MKHVYIQVIINDRKFVLKVVSAISFFFRPKHKWSYSSDISSWSASCPPHKQDVKNRVSVGSLHSEIIWWDIVCDLGTQAAYRDAFFCCPAYGAGS